MTSWDLKAIKGHTLRDDRRSMGHIGKTQRGEDQVLPEIQGRHKYRRVK